MWCQTQAALPIQHFSWAEWTCGNYVHTSGTVGSHYKHMCDSEEFIWHLWDRTGAFTDV